MTMVEEPENTTEFSGTNRRKQASGVLKRLLWGVVIAVALLFVDYSLMFPSPSSSKDIFITTDCVTRLHRLGNSLYEEALKGDPETVSKLTIPDLLREAMLSGNPSVDDSHWVSKEKGIVCLANGGEPYYVFPVPAALMIQNQSAPVPILMCPPGAHRIRGEQETNVLYSDGTNGRLTKEEAEQLVSEYSPVQIEIIPAVSNGPKEQ